MFQGMHYVYAVYQEKSFTKAAARLYISQPSLSGAVKKIEEQLGFAIFDRSTVPLRVTDLGKEYIRSIEIIMDVENGFRNFINDVNDVKKGSFSIGGTNLFISYVLPSLLSTFMQKYPLIDVNIMEASSNELAEHLNNGDIDLLLDNVYMNEQIFEKKYICNEHLLLTVPSQLDINNQVRKYAMTAADIRAGMHINSHIQAVPLEVFHDARFILQKAGNDTRIRAEHLCRDSNFTPNICLELDQQITAYNLSCAGLGISFCGDVLINHVPANADVLYYKLANQEALRTVNLFYKRGRYLPRAAREFLSIIP